jgi:hypothetical protein
MYVFVDGNSPESLTTVVKPESGATWNWYCSEEPEAGSARKTGVRPQVVNEAALSGASP